MRRTTFALIALWMLTALPVNGQTGTLPVIYIRTENGKPITSKTTYLPGTYYIADTQEPGMNVGSEEQPLALEIRGRGHSSWRGTKKPYKIRLAEKMPLLGMKRHRHWALLKFYEPTVAGLQLGRIMGMDWTASTRPVEVVLNGDYIGLYLLTETNRISGNRLDIYEQPYGNEDEETIPYGWLVEVDNYAEVNQISVQENASWRLRITSHSPDPLTAPQKAWLIREFDAINAAIYDEDKVNSTWEQLIDVDAMAHYFIIQEVLDNTDGFHGSFYLHKDMADDARWVAGPLWDLSCSQREKTDYTFRMKASYGFTPHWIGELIKDEDFCCAVRDAWQDFYPGEVQAWMDYIDEHLLFCTEAFEAEKKRWDYTSKATLTERLDTLKTSLLANIEWFNEHLPVGEVPDGIAAGDYRRGVAGVRYLNTAGVSSPRPWNGVNIKVVTYADGTTVTSKVVVRNR